MQGMILVEDAKNHLLVQVLGRKDVVHLYHPTVDLAALTVTRRINTQRQILVEDAKNHLLPQVQGH